MKGLKTPSAKTADYLLEDDPDDALIGELLKATPPVIGLEGAYPMLVIPVNLSCPWIVSMSVRTRPGCPCRPRSPRSRCGETPTKPKPIETSVKSCWRTMGCGVLGGRARSFSAR
ncbi:hypothetical protein QRX50_43365 [Amycolatopsis carbonis]|uniref:Uncharacterized protein n=1 Tax=Amycolatopsis carbonis TaxID=715471 RepID=A0A9Y2IQ88_9PSEU|nr:hypothetical protein [Amycolatopsis sp. 2-15]WIX84262.1 hypothetical protein QRX50_43365 [Amycolatopsis sp. 2-15]